MAQFFLEARHTCQSVLCEMAVGNTMEKHPSSLPENSVPKCISDKAKYSLAVKTLVEFSAKSGSLDRRFTPAPSAEEGREGHLLVQSTRPESYVKELYLSLDLDVLNVSGRADGYDSKSHCLEEIKTFYGKRERIPENHEKLHWAQILCYGHMLCQQKQCEGVNLALIYFNLAEKKEYRTQKYWDAKALEVEFQSLIQPYIAWHSKILQRQQKLLSWCENLNFPLRQMRPQQRQMAEAVFKAAKHQSQLMVQAPTGTGKTLASLFPAIKSIAYTDIDKIFYLTTKGTTKALALEALSTMVEHSGPLRVIEITAIDKACIAPNKQCHGESCPYALNFYNKLLVAREEASKIALLDKNALESLAAKYEICPFYLSMEMSRWTDVMVTDVNYYFDINALLLGLSKQMRWKPYVLVDESHNLIERARSTFSAELHRGLLLSCKKVAPRPIVKALNAINRHWLAMCKNGGEQSDSESSTIRAKAGANVREITEQSTEKSTVESAKESKRDNKRHNKRHNKRQDGNFEIIEELSEKFKLSLAAFVNAYTDVLQQVPDHPMQNGEVQEFFFQVVLFQQLLDYYDDDFVLQVESSSIAYSRLNLQNIIPANMMRSRFSVAAATCLFSATLSPFYFYQKMLGLEKDKLYSLDVTSPFSADQLSIQISQLSTRFKDREKTIVPICEIIHSQILNLPGNAIVYLPSYQYLSQIENCLRQKMSDTPVQIITQTPKMDEIERQQFILQFELHDNILALAVLGGIFSEGIDLKGDRLKGVYIATLGLPQFNPKNEYFRQVIDAKFDYGYEYTYLYPGIQKVVQAAGRVIRSHDDYGYAWLLDNRFNDPVIQQLLPSHWLLR